MDQLLTIIQNIASRTVYVMAYLLVEPGRETTTPGQGVSDEREAAPAPE